MQNKSKHSPYIYTLSKIFLAILFFLLVYKINIKIDIKDKKVLFDNIKVYTSFPISKLIVPAQCSVLVNNQKIEDNFYLENNSLKVYVLPFPVSGIIEIKMQCNGEIHRRIQLFNLRRIMKQKKTSQTAGCTIYFLNRKLDLYDIFNRVFKIKSKLNPSIISTKYQIVAEDLSKVLEKKEGTCGPKSIILNDLLCSYNSKIESRILVGVLHKKGIWYHVINEVKGWWIDPTNNQVFYVNGFIPFYELKRKYINRPFKEGDDYYYAVTPLLFINSPYEKVLEHNLYLF